MSQTAFSPNAAAVGLDGKFAEGQAEPRSLRIFGSPYACKLFKDMLELVSRNPRPVVFDGDFHTVACRGGGYAD